MKIGCRKLPLGTVLACVISMLTVSGALSAVPSEKYMAVAIPHYLSSVEFVTSLSGAQIATLASGKTIPWDDLNEATKGQLLHSARTVLGESMFNQTLEGLSSDTKLGVVIEVAAVLKLRNPSLGSSEQVCFEIGKYLPSTVAVEVGQVEPPPSFESIVSNLPTNQEERLNQLRELSRSLISVVSAEQLKGKEIPFPVGDLPGGITVIAKSATAEQSEWLGRMYEAYRQDVVAEQTLLKEHALSTGQGPFTADGQPIIVVDLKGHAANPLTTPEYALPAWSAISDGTTAQLYAQYTLMIKVISGCSSCGKGSGWVLKIAD